MGRFDSVEARDRVMVALDCGIDEARRLARSLEGHATWLKVGVTLVYAGGLSLVGEFRERGFRVFVDAKFHDIPHQVEGAVRSAALSGADLVTVHASGGRAMLEAARRGADQALAEIGARTLVAAITVLTSMDAAALAEVGISRPLDEQVDDLARLASSSGADGVVCSPREAAQMRGLLGPDALVVTPGVRPAGSAVGDQSRVATPADAIGCGATHIVIGRPVTEADDPVRALEAVVRSIA